MDLGDVPFLSTLRMAWWPPGRGLREPVGSSSLVTSRLYSRSAVVQKATAHLQIKKHEAADAIDINSTAACQYPSTAPHLGLAWLPSPARYGLRTSQPGRRRISMGTAWPVLPLATLVKYT